MAYALCIAWIIGVGTACQSQNGASDQAREETAEASSSAPEMPNGVFADTGSGLADYWYQGLAEISTYDLQQNRYQALHPGQAILIFVTEDFLTGEQVKNDHYTNPNSTSVMKTNFLRRFTTGLYDYSVMTSVFTPVQSKRFPFTLKVTHSSQDWCGQTFSQVNFREGRYTQQLHSYFESEGDRATSLPPAILEDELFNRIRMYGPSSLPTGAHQVIPALTHLRFAHQPFAAHRAELAVDDYTGGEFPGDNLKVYTVQYEGIKRRLAVVFQAEPPYRIEGWTESSPSAFDQEVRTTIARRSETALKPYWKLNGTGDRDLRAELGLPL